MKPSATAKQSAKQDSDELEFRKCKNDQAVDGGMLDPRDLTTTDPVPADVLKPAEKEDKEE